MRICNNLCLYITLLLQSADPPVVKLQMYDDQIIEGICDFTYAKVEIYVTDISENIHSISSMPSRIYAPSI